MTSSLWRTAAAAFALACAAGAGFAQQAFPDKPIRLLVAFAPGTGGDTLARMVGAGMARVLGQPVVVENRPGAGGTTGTEQGARAPADGYTLTLGTTSTLLTNPALNAKVRYHAEKDFVAVAGLARTAFVVVTANTPGAPATLKELLERLRGGGESFASAGVGTVTHLGSELMLKQAGVHATHVPYRGSSNALTDVAAGQVLFATDTSVAALPLIRGGRLRALAVTSAERAAALPTVPTAAQAGLPALRVTAWWGLMAPAGTPPEVVRKLSDAALKALEAPEAKAQLASQELQPMALGAAAFAQLIHQELPVWTQFVKDLGIQVEF